MRIAHAQTVGALGETFDEFPVDALLNEDARTGGAALAVDREDGEQRGVERPLDVGVFKISTGDLPPSSMENFFSPALSMMRRPVAVPPVKETARTSLWRTNASPAVAP